MLSQCHSPSWNECCHNVMVSESSRVVVLMVTVLNKRIRGRGTYRYWRTDGQHGESLIRNFSTRRANVCIYICIHINVYTYILVCTYMYVVRGMFSREGRLWNFGGNRGKKQYANDSFLRKKKKMC